MYGGHPITCNEIDFDLFSFRTIILIWSGIAFNITSLGICNWNRQFQDYNVLRFCPLFHFSSLSLAMACVRICIGDVCVCVFCVWFDRQSIMYPFLLFFFCRHTPHVIHLATHKSIRRIWYMHSEWFSVRVTTVNVRRIVTYSTVARYSYGSPFVMSKPSDPFLAMLNIMYAVLGEGLRALFVVTLNDHNFEWHRCAEKQHRQLRCVCVCGQCIGNLNTNNVHILLFFFFVCTIFLICIEFTGYGTEWTGWHQSVYFWIRWMLFYFWDMKK